jgi:hypothetical protein
LAKGKIIGKHVATLAELHAENKALRETVHEKGKEYEELAELFQRQAKIEEYRVIIKEQL